MFAGYAYANEPYAGLQNQQETISETPGGPYNLTVGVAIPAITITCADPDGWATTLSLVSGSLPAGLSLSRSLPATVDTPFTTTITGTPTTPGSATLVFRCDDGEGLVADLSISFLVVAAGPPILIGGPLLGIIYGSPASIIHGGGRGWRFKS